MKIDHKRYLSLLSITAALLGVTGCQKILTVPDPQTEIVLSVAFNDSTTATAAVKGIYSNMLAHTKFELDGVTVYPGLSSDELAVTASAADPFQLNAIQTTDANVNAMWTQAYQSLLQINTCIKGVESSTKLTNTLKTQLRGEAYFSRAFVNFYLVNLFGDAAPLVLSPDIDDTKTAGSTSSAVTYQQIVSDLKTAQSLLTNTYPTTGRVRPNAMAATALLARVYLYLKQYSDAAAQANTVLTSGLYTPLPTLANTFLVASQEAIWEVQPRSGTFENTADANIFIPVSVLLPPTYYVTPQLLAAFETGDQRKTNWLKSFVYKTATYYYPYKYKNSSSVVNGPIVEDNIMLRASEQYLIRAEAYCNLNRTPDAVADINVIRARAGLPGLSTTLSTSACMAAVEQEKRIEFFAEFGHRWLDMKRWPGVSNPSITLADEVLPALKSGWVPEDKLYPVPATEILYNPNLIQNPGYK